MRKHMTERFFSHVLNRRLKGTTHLRLFDRFRRRLLAILVVNKETVLGQSLWEVLYVD